jgi:hypothetical protein
MRYIILVSCFYLYVNDNYQLFICEPEQEVTQPLIEVIEGDGYAEKKNVTHSQLMDNFNMVMFDRSREY